MRTGWNSGRWRGCYRVPSTAKNAACSSVRTPLMHHAYLWGPVNHQARAHDWYLLTEISPQYHSVAINCNQFNAAGMDLDGGYVFAVTEIAAAKLKFKYTTWSRSWRSWIDPAHVCPGFPSLPDAMQAVQARALKTVYTVRYDRIELPSSPTSITQVLDHAYVELVISKNRGPLELACWIQSIW
jgi:hypothetical protein